MTDSSYRPDGLAETHPIECVTSWIGSLFRPPAPAYGHAEPKGPVIAHVRGVVVERTPVCQADGSTIDDGTGLVVGITLVVDDDEAATTVLEAIADGAPIRVLSGGRG